MKDNATEMSQGHAEFCFDCSISARGLIEKI